MNARHVSFLKPFLFRGMPGSDHRTPFESSHLDRNIKTLFFCLFFDIEQKGFPQKHFSFLSTFFLLLYSSPSPFALLLMSAASHAKINKSDGGILNKLQQAMLNLETCFTSWLRSSCSTFFPFVLCSIFCSKTDWISQCLVIHVHLTLFLLGFLNCT